MTSGSTSERRLPRLQADKVDARPGQRVALLAARQWGVISIGELLRCGLSRDAVSVRIRNGQLHRLHRGVYAVGHGNLPIEGRFLAAVKACGPGALLSHFSAASLLGLVRWDDRFPEVTVAGESTRIHRGIRVHRTSRIDPRDAGRHLGVPITAAARTLIDVAASLDARRLRRAVREAQSLRLIELRDLLETMGRLGPRRGTRK